MKISNVNKIIIFLYINNIEKFNLKLIMMPLKINKKNETILKKALIIKIRTYKMNTKCIICFCTQISLIFSINDHVKRKIINFF